VVKNAARSDGKHVKLLYLLCLVRGMWEKKPGGWPTSVEFVDPNNKVKSAAGNDNESKPTKDVLIPMLEHLVKKYQVMAMLHFFLVV
jgi:hypothetical protein